MVAGTGHQLMLTVLYKEMKQVRRLGLTASQSLFRFFLALSIVFMAITPLVLSGDTIKATLRDVNAYVRFRDAVVAENSNAGNLLADPRIKDIAKTSFTSDLLQQNLESAIDNTYVWLQGESPNPDISIDFTNAEATFLTNLRQYALQRFVELPTCQFIVQEIDPLTTTCTPEGVNAAQITLAIEQGVESAASLLPQTVITEDDIFVDTSGESVFERYSDAPKYYGIAQYSAWILSGITLLLAASMILLHKRKAVAVRSLGLSIVSVSVGLALLTYVFGVLLTSQAEQLGSGLGAQPAVQQLTQNVSETLLLLARQNIITVALYVALGGLVVLIAGNLLPRGSSYKDIRLKSGLVSSNERPGQKGETKNSKYRSSPVQSSEDTRAKKPKKRNAKVRKITKGLE